MKIEIDKSSMVPIYEQIADGLRDLMYGGNLQDGDKIDSEQKMCMDLGISRATVRKALNILIKEGRIRKIHGKGTYVIQPNVEYSLNDKLFSFAESLAQQQLNYETQVIKQELLPANKKIAEQLKIDVGNKYLYLERIRSINNEKIMLIENRINVKHCRGIENSNFNNVSLFAKIEELSRRKISFAKSSYEALIVGSERGKLLDLAPNLPILKMQQTVFLSKNEPVEYGSVWLKANKYLLTTTLQRR
ncbi:GntR family transcriptional regulator [Xylocopilactobacillus apicola]|uniref:HTH gntR-type domain-containing protein n=1 Tax=Xylocopilactobacillus apicola TaxID=2932184 RepID=A0AAU9D539_9LACO|nr:GntR family transcriptional regulator [Xylocopilactobacillus apicola]BDR57596.1 hypothetical protein XA3_00370 [Xylocopilactobacillus apicola]